MPKNYKIKLQKYNLIKIKGKKIDIELKHPNDLHNITHDLIKSGFKIKHIKIKEPTLEEVFIKIARGEL